MSPVPASFSSLKTELERVKTEKEQVRKNPSQNALNSNRFWLILNLFCHEQLETSLAEKSQALVSIQGLKSSLEEQLKDALSSKVRSHDQSGLHYSNLPQLRFDQNALLPYTTRFCKVRIAK